MKMIKKIALFSSLALLTTGFVFASGKKDVKVDTKESIEAEKEAAEENVEQPAETVDASLSDAK